MLQVGLLTYVLIAYIGVGLLISYALLSHATLFGIIRYLTLEKISILTLGNAAFATVALTLQLILKITLGRLRELEVEQLIEHGKSTILDTILFLILAAPTVDEGEVPHSVLSTCLSGIICSKLFHSLAQIRVAHLSEAGLIEVKNLGKLALLLLILIGLDVIAVSICYSRATFASTFYLWILFEALGLLVMSGTGLCKIAVLFVDLNLEAAGTGGWRPKNEYMFCLDLAQNVGTLVIYLIFLLLFVFANPSRLPFYLASDIIQVTKTLITKITSFRRYRKLAARLEVDFPEPSLEELEEADTCIICRDALTIGSKKLICGHILHFDCLKGWFVHHQSCPTCRTEIPIQKPPSPTASSSATTQVRSADPAAPFAYAAESVVGGPTLLKGYKLEIVPVYARAPAWQSFFLGPRKEQFTTDEGNKILRINAGKNSPVGGRGESKHTGSTMSQLYDAIQQIEKDQIELDTMLDRLRLLIARHHCD